MRGIAFYPRSTWLVASESAPKSESVSIAILDVLGSRAGNVARLADHSAPPLAVDVDPTGTLAASLHGDRRVNLWNAESLRRLPKTAATENLSDHSVDDECRWVLSRNRDTHGHLCLTDTTNGKDAFGEYRIPAIHARLDPAGQYIAMWYPSQPPLNPILGGDPNQDAPSRRWHERFWKTTSIQCGLHSLAELLSETKKRTPLSEAGHSQIAFPQYRRAMISWSLPLGLRPTNLILGARGSWGASLLKDDKGELSLFRFDRESGKSHLNSFPWPLTAAALTHTDDRARLALLIVREQVLIRTIDPLNEGLPVIEELSEIGTQASFSGLPLVLKNQRCLLIRNRATIELSAPASRSESAEGEWPVFSLTKENVREHDSAALDWTTSHDELHLVILDVKPSISIYCLPELTLVCRRILDRQYSSVHISEDGRSILAVDGDRRLNGVSYSLSEIVTTC